VHDVNDVIQHMTDMWAGVEQSVIDDAIGQRRKRLVSMPACLRVTGGYFKYWLWQKL